MFNFVDLPYYAVESFDRKYEGKLVNFLKKHKIEQPRQSSSSMIIWEGNTNYGCSINPIIYTPGIHSIKPDKYDLTLQFSGIGAINNSSIMNFLIDLAIECNIKEYFNHDLNKTKSLYLVLDKQRKTLIPEIKDKSQNSLQEILESRRTTSQNTELAKQNEILKAQLGITDEQIKQDLKNNIGWTRKHLNKIKMKNIR